MSRISPGTIIVGIFAILFGLVGAYAVRQYLTQELEVAAEEPAPPQVFRIPVASVDLKPGRPLNVSDVAILRLTREQLIEQNLPENYMTNPRQIFNRILRGPLKQGEAFLTTQFYPIGMGPNVAERLKPGYRAMTIPVTNPLTVAGFATPGSLVDVLFRTFPNSRSELQETTVTLLENVEVLALGLNQVPGTNTAGRSQNTVTLAVTPHQANALKVVEKRGELSLVLRAPDDVVMNAAAEPQTLRTLLGLNKPTFSTEVYRGGRLEVNTFRNDESAPMAFTRLPVGSPATAQTQVPNAAAGENTTSIETPPEAPVTDEPNATQGEPATAGVPTSLTPGS
jgi:pilus assembly protein CpaB